MSSMSRIGRRNKKTPKSAISSLPVKNSGLKSHRRRDHTPAQVRTWRENPV